MKTREWKIAAGEMKITSALTRKLSPGVRASVCLISFLLLSTQLVHAQSYSIDWHKIAGGGGTSTNSQYSVTGTIGQPDASMAMSGGQYSVTGGFWSFINVVQTAGLPNLIISESGSSVIVSWPDTGSYTLQQSADIGAVNGWATSGYSISTASGTNSITITSPTGNLFFRLSKL